MKSVVHLVFAIVFIVSSLAAMGEPAVQETTVPENIYTPIVSSKNYAAIVNDEIISLDEFNEAMAAAHHNIYTSGAVDLGSTEGLSILNTTGRAILDDLIDQKIIEQQAKIMDIQISTANIEEEIALLQQGFPSAEQFMATLYEEHIDPEELREGIHDRLVLKKIKGNLSETASIEDHEIDAFLEQNRHFSNLTVSKQYRVLQFSEPESAEKAYQELVSGSSIESLQEDFEIELVVENTEQIDFSVLSPQQIDKITLLDDGQYSEVLETLSGYSIYYCVQVHDDDQEIYQELARREARRYLQQKKENELFRDWFREIRRNSYIKINRDTIEEHRQNEQQKNRPPKLEEPFINIS